MVRYIYSTLLAVQFVAATSTAQQLPDTTYRFSIQQCAYPEGGGPVVMVDEAHNNLHRRDGGFTAFSRLLEQDGYVVLSLTTPVVSVDELKECDILVIVNALHESNLGNWTLPTPSAFTQGEIATLKQWVRDGGKLLLIADHMPYGGAAELLGKAFGFGFVNGFAMTGHGFQSPSVFSLENGGLKDSKLIRGLSEYESVNHVATFTGSAFTIPDHAIPVLSFSGEHRSLQPDTAWRFNENTPVVWLEDYYQGALLSFGQGKIAVFGEAAMFTAQVVNGIHKAGFNSEYAPQNAQFTLNLVHWLDGVQEYTGATENFPVRDDAADPILEQNRAMERAFTDNDFAGVASFYSDDAVMIGNRHEVTGRRAIDEYWLGLKDRGISWELENTHIEIHNNLAIQRGVSRMTFMHDDQEHMSAVRFTLIWKRINGRWLIEVDHYSLL